MTRGAATANGEAVRSGAERSASPPGCSRPRRAAPRRAARGRHYARPRGGLPVVLGVRVRE